MNEQDWFKRFMGMPPEKKEPDPTLPPVDTMRQFVKVVTWIVAILMVIMVVIVLTGCETYYAAKEKCRVSCKEVQKDNVGARFMWQDADLTFGKCTCYSKDGSTKTMFVRTKP